MPVTQEAACLQIERDMLASCCKMPILYEGLAEGYIIEAHPGPKEIEDLSAWESHHAQLVAMGYLGISLSELKKREPERIVDPAGSEAMSYFCLEVHSPSASSISQQARRHRLSWSCIAGWYSID